MHTSRGPLRATTTFVTVNYDVDRLFPGLAERDGLHWVPSLHEDLVRGVATYTLELLEAVPNLRRVYVPIGLGSGICGMIRTRDLLGLDTEIIGVVSSEADAFAQIVAAASK